MSNVARAVHIDGCNNQCEGDSHFLLAYETPQACSGCGKSATACGRSNHPCCPSCSRSQFGTHYSRGGE